MFKGVKDYLVMVFKKLTGLKIITRYNTIMGILTEGDLSELEENLLNSQSIRERNLCVRKTKNCCELTLHTILAICFSLVNCIPQTIANIYFLWFNN